MSAEIFMVPKTGQGHLFPSLELCKRLLLLNYKISFIVDSDVTSSIHCSLLQSSLFQLHYISSASDMESFLSQGAPKTTRPLCAVIDHIMNKTQQVFWKFHIPTVIFITSGACWAAVQHAAYVVKPADMRPGEIRSLPGLPEDMVLAYSDLKQRHHWLPPAPVSAPSGRILRRGPPFPGEPAPWVEEVKNASAMLINTCDYLERPFLDYVSNLTGKTVWGVGPLLPENYWGSAVYVLRDQEIRPKRESNHSEDDIIEWLNSKPRGSVIYISFGSEVGPPMEEFIELANALGESTRPFIWVIQRSESNYFPQALDKKVGKRGMIIHGWAPQLMILSHPSAGGFVSHCGWNSTVEAIIRGIPLLAWPIRGDQYYNAKLVVHYLKVGTLVCDGYPAYNVKKINIVEGIEKVLSDEEIRERALILCEKFKDGFPESSLKSLKCFVDFMKESVNNCPENA